MTLSLLDDYLFNSMSIDLVLRMNQAVHVDLSVKTAITLLWNVLYMIILEEMYL